MRDGFAIVFSIGGSTSRGLGAERQTACETVRLLLLGLLGSLQHPGQPSHLLLLDAGPGCGLLIP